MNKFRGSCESLYKMPVSIKEENSSVKNNSVIKQNKNMSFESKEPESIGMRVVVNEVYHRDSVSNKN